MDTLLAGGSDSNSVLFTPSTNLTLFPHLYKDLRYTSDFTPLGTASQFNLGWRWEPTVRPGHREFLQLAQKDMRMAAFGTPGAGTVMNYLGIMLGNVSKVALTPIPYKEARRHWLTRWEARCPR